MDKNRDTQKKNHSPDPGNSSRESPEMLYRNYANGYGRNVRNYGNGYGTGKQPAAQPAANSQTLHAYNRDYENPRETSKAPAAAQSQSTTAQRAAARPPKKRSGCLIGIVGILAVLGLLLLGSSLFFKPPQTPMPLAERKEGTATILLCGTDVGGYRTDTMMLLYIDSKNKEAGLLSLPRDTYTHTAYGEEAKLNSAYGRNGCGTEGMEVLYDYVRNILGYYPDGHVLIELPMLEKLVDLMGGVDFDVPTEITFRDSDMDLDVTLEPGMQHLDGNKALGLVRFRYGYYNQDLGRAETQKNFLKACMNQWFTTENLGKLKEAMTLFREESLTNLTDSNYLWIASNLLRCGISNVRTDILPGYGDYVGDQAFYILYPDEVLELVNEFYNPYTREITWDDISIAEVD